MLYKKRIKNNTKGKQKSAQPNTKNSYSKTFDIIIYQLKAIEKVHLSVNLIAKITQYKKVIEKNISFESLDFSNKYFL